MNHLHTGRDHMILMAAVLINMCSFPPNKSAVLSSWHVVQVSAVGLWIRASELILYAYDLALRFEAHNMTEYLTFNTWNYIFVWGALKKT